MKKRILAALMLILFCFACTVELLPAQAAAKKVYVVANTLKIYKKASGSSKTIATLSYGQSLSLLATSGAWAKVKGGGKIGFCKKSALSTRNPNSLSKTVYINTANTKVYQCPSTSSKVLMKLKLNSRYKAVAKTVDGKWYRLKNGSYYGYVPVKYTSASKVAVPSKTSAPAKTTKADKIVALAKKQLGKGYAYGAEGASRFDCSGLTYYVYKSAAGKALRRTSEDQAADSRFKKITSLSSAQKGDLLCFVTGSGSKCDHVGVYIGGGKFIHASQSKGKVITSSLTDYWKDAFLCARRIV